MAFVTPVQIAIANRSHPSKFLGHAVTSPAHAASPAVSHLAHAYPPSALPTRCTLSTGETVVVGGGVTPSADKFTAYDGQNLEAFIKLASQPNVRMVPLWQKVFSDQLTPVEAYRCLVSEKDLATPSFLLESVNHANQTGRYSLLGARPVCDVVAYAHDITVTTYDSEHVSSRYERSDDPWQLIREMSESFCAAVPPEIPGGTHVFNGGWVGYGGYDTMRYAELKSLPFSSAPKDDRNLPDLHLGLYRDVIVFDHVTKVIYIVHWTDLEQSLPNAVASSSSPPTIADFTAAHTSALKHLNELTDVILAATPLSPISPGRVSINTNAAAVTPYKSNMTKEEFMEGLKKIHHHLCVGDTFQTVFSQRFERWSNRTPFDVYRALRIINPSPYMIYMQCKDCVLVASSPEILTRVEDGVLTNRPLAGTRRRGTTEEEDIALAKDLLSDGKDRSEHMMLVDLGRNDVGKVSEYGSVDPIRVMEVERYSHVMHISSTIIGKLKKGLTSWDALRSTLPAGTISGAPKIRAMQIIDDLEPTKRGPYGGGIGYISFCDTMNMALALRTMVVPSKKELNAEGESGWLYYLQAGAGIVFESDPEAEYRETVNKAMALNRAIDLAESAF